jgi:hypothetical protein
VEGLLATPFPTPEEARAFVGEWVGDLWMNSDAPRTGRLTLRIGIVDGHVVGETLHRTQEGEVRVQRWEYLEITLVGPLFRRDTIPAARGVRTTGGHRA